MKRDLMTPLGFLALLLILTGSLAFLPAGAETIIGTAKFEPNRFDLTLGFGVSIVEGTIRFETESVADINTSTILLEGSLPPSSTYMISGGLVARFDAVIVEFLMWAKINHVGVPKLPYKVWLTITGKLNDTAGGTSFSAEGYIKIIGSYSPPPP